MTSSISGVTLPSSSPRVKKPLAALLESNARLYRCTEGEQCRKGPRCYFIFLKYGHCKKDACKNWKVLWGRKTLSPPLTSQHIHLAYASVRVNSPPLCGRRRQDTFIFFWMDSITYSRPLCFRGEGDQTSIYCKADLGPFNWLWHIGAKRDFFFSFRDGKILQNLNGDAL